MTDDSRTTVPTRSDQAGKHPPRFRARWGLVVLVAIAVAAPFVLSRLFNAMPQSIEIAGGPVEGRFHQLAVAIQNELKTLGIDADSYPGSEGSVDNLAALAGGTELAIWQPSLGNSELPPDVRFITNLYPQPVHIIVRKSPELDEIVELRGKRIGIGVRGSGDLELNRIILSDLGIPLSAVDAVEATVQDMQTQLLAGELDAAIITRGIGPSMFSGILDREEFAILPIPYPENLERKRPSLRPFKLTKGLYHLYPHPVPSQDIWTVALEAQLLVRADATSSFVERVTRLVHNQDFLLANQLLELYRDDAAHSYARQKPSFPYHPGATNYYEPELKPLLSPEFVEATEGIRSFVVSILIAGFLLFRWVRERRGRSRGSRLDKYMTRLLEIEREQLDLDQSSRTSDIGPLQKHLDEVTELRREALGEFNTYQMNDEPGVDMFLEMSHALTDKINAKLTRQRTDLALMELADRIQRSDGSGSSPDSSA